MKPRACSRVALAWRARCCELVGLHARAAELRAQAAATPEQGVLALEAERARLGARLLDARAAAGDPHAAVIAAGLGLPAADQAPNFFMRPVDVEAVFGPEVAARLFTPEVERAAAEAAGTDPRRPRFTIERFDHETLAVIDTATHTEVALVGEFDGQPAPADERARMVADALNAAVPRAQP